MAGTVSSLVVKIGADISELQSAMGKVQSSVKDAGKRMTSLGKTITTRVTAPLAGLGALAVKTAGDYETLQTSMNTLNGSVREGTRNFERLKEFSARTPFQLGDLASAQNMLQGFGLAADDAFDSLSMIGDIAAISGGSIEGIGIAFGQAAAEGRLMTRDIRQLINQGVPAIKLLADTMGVAEDQILQMASEGKISFDILQQAFQDATSEGGMFANGMEQQSKTINGLFSTLKDNVSLALGELGDAIVDSLSLREVIPQLIKNIQAAVSWFKRLSDESKRQIIILVTAIAGIGPALVTAGIAVASFGAVLGALMSPITLIIGGITGIVLAATYVVKNLEAIGDAIKEEFRSWVVAAMNTKTLIEKAVLSIASLAPGIAGTAARAMNQVLKVDQGVIDDNKTQFQSFGEFAKDVAGDIGNAFASITGIDFSTMFTPVSDGIVEVSDGIKRASSPLESYRDRVMRIGESFTKPVEQMKEMKKTAIDMSDALQSSITSAATSFAESIGEMIASGGDGQTFFNTLLSMMADFAVQFGRIVLAMGVAALQLQNLFANPVAAIAAGGALIALGTAAKSLISKGPGGSSGAVSQDFQPSARSVPAEQGGNVTFEIEYDKLVGVLDNGSRRRGRVG